MGLSQLSAIVSKLIRHGRSPETPVAVIRWGTTEEQESIVGTLADIVEKSALLAAPALIVVGDVVSLADKLQWFYPMPYNPARDGIGFESELART
jgi:siroheme synthase